MPTTAEHKRRFSSAVADCMALYQHCMHPRDRHSIPGVEAAFLQVFMAWEVFLEDSLLGFMCGRLTCDAKLVAARMIGQSEEDVRVALYQERPYLEWSDPERTIERLERLLVQPSRPAAALRAGLVQLRQMRTVRNFIAHASVQARQKFFGLLQSEFGGKRRLSRAGLLLIESHPQDATVTYFLYYVQTLQALVAKITG